MRSRESYRVTQLRVVRSEWVKLRSLRSTVYALLGMFVVVVGIALIAAAATNGDASAPTAGEPGTGRSFVLDATTLALVGSGLAQLVVGVLGVLVMSGEYTTGMIRSTMAAVPRRLPVLWAKVLVLSLVTFTLTFVALVVAFYASQAILGDQLPASLADGTVLRRVAGTALYLTGISVIGVALGALLRSTAGAISVLFGALLVIPGVVQLALPKAWGDAIFPYLPSSAGDAFTGSALIGQVRGLLDPGPGLLVFGVYVALLLLLAAFRLVRSDV